MKRVFPNYVRLITNSQTSKSLNKIFSLQNIFSFLLLVEATPCEIKPGAMSCAKLQRGVLFIELRHEIFKYSFPVFDDGLVKNQLESLKQSA